METQALSQLASTGLAGAMLVLALLALRSKDRELSEEKAHRIKDSQEMMMLVMKIQSSVIEAVHQLSEIVETWEKREDERRRERSTERPGNR